MEETPEDNKNKKRSMKEERVETVMINTAVFFK